MYRMAVEAQITFIIGLKQCHSPIDWYVNGLVEISNHRQMFAATVSEDLTADMYIYIYIYIYLHTRKYIMFAITC